MRECTQETCLYYAFGNCLYLDKCDGSEPIKEIKEENFEELNSIIDLNSLEGTFDDEDWILDEDFNDINF